MIGLRKGASNVQGLHMGGEGYLWEGTQQTIKYLPSNAPQLCIMVSLWAAVYLCRLKVDQNSILDVLLTHVVDGTEP